MSLSKKVFVVYYSTFGHVEKLAKHICIGLEKSGVTPKIFQVEETLPDDILKKMKAPPKSKFVPIIKPEELIDADGIMFGMPTRFGMVPAQMKTLFDSCGQIWLRHELANVPTGLFFSTSTIGGGQETTALSTIPFLAHLGMIYVPLGGKPHKLNDLSEIHGGSAYGCGTISGMDNSRLPNDIELETAEFQGFDFGNFIKRISVDSIEPCEK